VRGPDIPTDDLYARLELPRDAAPEAIEIAWRALLKRHHPDVAGEASLEAAKRINVAHDWLTDPALRARYDADASRRPATSIRAAPTGTVRRPAPTTTAERSRATRRLRPTFDWDADPRPVDLDLDSPAVVDFLLAVESLGRDDLDRLALADPPPIAFVASIRRFLSADRVEALDALDVAIRARLPRGARRSTIRDAVTSYGQHLLIAGFLADELSEPFRERVEERMTRGWQAAVGRARYGPETAAVDALIARAGRLGRADGERLADAAARLGLPDRPWPRRVDPAEDEALRISADLAAADATAAAREGGASGRVALAVGGFAHVTALGSSFGRTEAGRLLRPWRELAEVAAAR
jgi:curved DNA-binding protein CbpA